VKDTEQPKAGGRPNSEYRLSHENQGEEEMVFRYSREKRLSKAPKSVQDLFSENPRPRFNLLGPPAGRKSRAVMLGSILLLCVVILMMSIFGFLDRGYAFGGGRLTVEALRFEGTTIVSLKKTRIKNRNAYTGAVDIGVSPALKPGTEAREGDYPVFFQRVFFTAADEEEYRFAAPFDSEELVLVFRGERETLDLKIKCE
jgi:hypothetical protein